MVLSNKIWDGWRLLNKVGNSDSQVFEFWLKINKAINVIELILNSSLSLSLTLLLLLKNLKKRIVFSLYNFLESLLNFD